MERHSSPDPAMDRNSRVSSSPRTAPLDGPVVCTCPPRPPRVCRVTGCDTRLSIYNPDPFCNSCRINVHDSTPYIHPPDHDGITAHDCEEITQ